MFSEKVSFVNPGARRQLVKTSSPFFTPVRLPRVPAPAREIKSRLGDDVRSTAQESFEVRNEPAWEPRTGIRTQVDERIYVAVQPRVTTRH